MISARDVLLDIRYSLRHPRVKPLLIAALSLSIITAIAAAVVWYPASAEMDTLRRDVEAQRRAAVSAVYAGQLAAAYEQAARVLPELEKKLDHTFTQADLVTDLGKLARKHGLKLVSQSFEEAKIKNGYQPLRIDIGLQGRYADLRKFLLGLQTLPSWMVVEQAAFRRQGEGRLVKVQLQLLTYRQSTGDRQ